MPNPRIYPPRGSAPLPNTRDLSADSDEEFLNVYSNLEYLEESDNDIKSIILEQLRKYRHVSVKLKRGSNSNRYVVLTFDDVDSLNYFKRAILERKDRVIVYDRVLFFNFNRVRFNQSNSRSTSYRTGDNYERRDYSPKRHQESRSYSRYERRDDDVRKPPTAITRTLFIGNLDDDIEDTEIKRVFEPYGDLLEVVIKHPPGTRSNPYAFVKFKKLSAAMDAREHLNDTCLGRKHLKIGFGKVSPSHGLWIGGLNETTTDEELTTEVKRCSHYADYKYLKDENMAYFIFETIDDCKRAYHGLKSVKLIHSGAKLEIDYSDIHSEARDLMQSIRSRERRRSHSSSTNGRVRRKSKERARPRSRSLAGGSSYRTGRQRSRSPPSPYKHSHHSDDVSPQRSDSNDGKIEKMTDDRSYTPLVRSNGESRKKELDSIHSSPSNFSHKRKSSKQGNEKEDNTNEKIPSISSILNSTAAQQSPHASTLSSRTSSVPTIDMVHILSFYPVVWKGAITVKTNITTVELHLICGTVDPVSTMVHQATLANKSPTLIHLTKRFPLLPDRVADLRNKLAAAISSRDCCVLVAQQSISSDDQRDISAGMVSRPISHMISYFLQKQAAGIGSIGGISIYCFPPSPFTQEQLVTLMPHASNAVGSSSDSYLMIVISR